LRKQKKRRVELGYYGENADNRLLKSKFGRTFVRPINSMDDAADLIRSQLNVKELEMATRMLDERRRKRPKGKINGIGKN
jgi:hypothetical protein